MLRVIGKSRLGCYLYVFLLPFWAGDRTDAAFVSDEEFDGVFRHHATVPSWRSLDLSDSVNVMPVPRMHLTVDPPDP